MEEVNAGRVVAKSEAVVKDALSLIPGGLTWAFNSLCGPPHLPAGLSSTTDADTLCDTLPVIVKGKGARLTDLDGNEYVDYLGANGALILGHADERIVAAISKTASKGFAFGAPSDLEVRLAELIASRFPAIDMLRLVTTPAEALAHAVALARRYTGRPGILMFDGFWHGRGVDKVQLCPPRGAGTGDATPSLSVPYNDAKALKGILRERGADIAAVVVEPVAVSIGLVPPVDGFLESLRSVCNDHKAVLIFDETMTGPRLAAGGASAFCGVEPDLTLLGPMIGGGLPLAAYGGRKEIMKLTGDAADMPPAGSGAGNLLGVAAGVATLQALGEPGFYDALEGLSARLDEGLRAVTAALQVPICHVRVASMLGMFFREAPVSDAASACRCDADMFARYYKAMLDRGVLLPPSPVSCLFVSAAHTEDDIEQTIEAAHDALHLAATDTGP